jgi:hypothetical protein
LVHRGRAYVRGTRGDSYRLREKKKAGLLGRKKLAKSWPGPAQAGRAIASTWEPRREAADTISVNRGHLASSMFRTTISASTEPAAGVKAADRRAQSWRLPPRRKDGPYEPVQ